MTTTTPMTAAEIVATIKAMYEGEPAEALQQGVREFLTAPYAHAADFDGPQNAEAVDAAVAMLREQFPMSLKPAVAGYFSGDWEWDYDLEMFKFAYAAVRFGDDWNGWATPVVTYPVLAAIAGRMAMFAASDDEQQYLIVDGNGFLLLSPNGTDAPDETFLVPDADGLFDLSPMGWTWSELEDARAIEKIG